MLPNTYRFLAEALLGQGRTEEALEAAQEALQRARQMGAQDLIGRAWRMLGVLAGKLRRPVTVEGGPVDAPACFAESLRRFEGRGAASERARTLREWAHYELAHGDRGRGQEMWQQAREIFARLGMGIEVERMA